MKKGKFLPLLVFSLFAGGITMTSCSNPGHVIVENKEIEYVSFIGNETPIEIGKFFERNVKIVLHYTDGTSEEFPITAGMFSEEELEVLQTLGTHEVTISFNGQTFKFVVRIVEEQPTTHTVNFYYLGTDGLYTVISTQTVENGEAATAPTIEGDVHNEADDHYYGFVSWDQEFDVVTGDLDVYAIIERTRCATVTFMNGNNEVIDTQVVDWGKNATEPAEEDYAMAGFRFVGWNRSYTNIPSDTTEIQVKGIYVSDGVTSYQDHEVIQYGYYPKTRVASSVLTNVLDQITPDANGYVSYCGSEYYKREDTFFKVEPVKWIVLNEDADSKLVIAKNPLNYTAAFDVEEDQSVITEMIGTSMFKQLFLDHNTLEASDVNHPNNLILNTSTDAWSRADEEYVTKNTKLFLPSEDDFAYFHSDLDFVTESTDYALGEYYCLFRETAPGTTHHTRSTINGRGQTWTEIHTRDVIRPCMNIKL